jgi:pimeloyl-ACP methyl ester carboxylesterase
MAERPPWEVSLPLDALRAAGFPILVVSGQNGATSEMLCDRLADLLSPNARRTVIPDAGHLVHRSGQPFNEVLESFLRDAEADAHP